MDARWSARVLRDCAWEGARAVEGVEGGKDGEHCCAVVPTDGQGVGAEAAGEEEDAERRKASQWCQVCRGGELVAPACVVGHGEEEREERRGVKGRT